LPSVFETEPEESRKIITDIQEAVMYEDIIAPVLQNKCYTCHGPKKQKGGLRLDKPDLIAKGGKDGKVLTPGNPDKSEMMDRLLLPPEDKDHMPPKERKQLTEAEIKLIHWWIENGADFAKKVKDYGSSDSIKPLFAALQIQDERKNIPNDEVPSESVATADSKLLDSIRSKGILITPVAAQNNFLAVSFINSSKVADSTVKLLENLAPQLLSLRMGGTLITDSALKSVGKLTKLVRLNLEYTSISDTGLQELKNLKNLQYINLVGTRVTISGVLQLNGLNKLKTIYLYKTGVKPQDWEAIKTALPNVLIDTGGYIVPILASDTTELKPPEKKKEKKKKKKDEKKEEEKEKE
jgi:mono/diheme cytochrome c family protein